MQVRGDQCRGDPVRPSGAENAPYVTVRTVPTPMHFPGLFRNPTVQTCTA